MLRIGICDDNQNDIKQICELAIRFSEEHPETLCRYRLTTHLLICLMILKKTVVLICTC